MEAVIYARNPTPYYGPILNEEEVVAFLARRGVFILEKGSLSMAVRINLFRQADVIIGPHGEGLTDVVFCKPGALLWELMPHHMHNSSYNHLAQAAELDYWGDQFGVIGQDVSSGWSVDLDILSERMRAVSRRLAVQVARPKSDLSLSPIGPMSRRLKPLDDLMLEFESLGDNCEFGLVQRSVGAEPLGLLRFAGFYLPVEIRLEKLVDALEADFIGLGSLDTVSVEAAGETREFMVTEGAYNLMYHSFMHEGEIEPEILRQREATRLTFLRRKLLEDLKNGEKVWVWKSNIKLTLDQIERLVAVLRRHGQNILLWVVEADDAHRPGSVERISDNLLKGYVERFAPYHNAPDISPQSWLEVCQAAYDLCNPSTVDELDEARASETPLTAMEYLARPTPVVTPEAPATTSWPGVISWLRNLLRWR